MSIFPTGYSPKPTPSGTDVVWSSDGLTNFNLTVSSIALYALTNSTTDNLTEGTVNKYYSDALVSANSTVVSKADKTNVLEKDNTTSYTPTLPYHPVTKDYADNMTIPDATNTIKGKIRIATDVEAGVGVDELTSINPKQLYYNNRITTIQATDNLKSSADIEQSRTIDDSSGGGIIEKIKEIQIGWFNLEGSARIKFDLKGEDLSVSDYSQAYATIRINGNTVYGPVNNKSNTYVSYSYDAVLNGGDTVQLWWSTDLRGSSTAGIKTKNFRIYYDDINYTRTPNVILD